MVPVIPDRSNGRKPAMRALWTAGALAAGVVLSACAPPPADDGSARGVRTELPASPTEQPPGSSAEPTGTSSDGSTPTSTSADTGPSESTSPSSTSKRAPADRCHTGDLSGSVQNQDSGAGQRYADLVLRNDSGRPCTVYGYGGMQLVDAGGRPVPTNLQREADPGPSLVRLAPGATTRSTLHWTVVATGDEPTDGPCEPEPAGARVTPPDETEQLTVAWNYGPVCDHGRISGSAYH